MRPVKRLVIVAVLAALELGAPTATPTAEASTPIPWCGTDVVSTDRLPDATAGFAVHVIYAYPAGSPDRFAAWAPRIAGDVAAMEAWWRTQDPTRTPRFDLFSFPCASVFGALDITRLPLPAPIGPVGPGVGTLRTILRGGFNASEKVYLVYYDGPSGQVSERRVCGQGAAPFRSQPGLSIVYLDSCDAETTDSLRPVVAVHELVHAFGAVARGAPHLCRDGHVCDVANDLMAASLSGNELETHVLDGGRNDYYGHTGRWLDIQDSLFLERLDSPDRAAPSTPAALDLRVSTAGAFFTWSPSTDDVGPVSYRITRNGQFFATVQNNSAALTGLGSGLTRLSIRAVDTVGHLSPPAELFFKGGLGVVDARGRLLRDTVAPPAIGPLTVIRLTRHAAAVSWKGVRDAGGLRGYRIRHGSRSLTVRQPAVTIDPSKLRGPVTIAAVDRAGNVGPLRTIPLSRFR